jgi:glycosyltransferase involved in cell wall biosynthesis
MFHVDVRKREISDRSHIFEGTTFGATGLKLAKRRLMGVLKSMVERLAWVLADSAVVETRAVQREIADLRPKREVRVIAHGLGESPSYENEEPSHVELLFVGTPGVRKRTHLLPAILERVREEVEGARLRVVGFTLDDDPGLKAEANRRGVTDSIEFVGRVRSEDVVPYYRAADVLLLPSAYEGLPMVLLEAMREGLVPVATDVSGHPDAINDDQNGILVPLDDVTGFGEKAARLLMDPVSRAASGRFSQETIRADFSLARELGEYLQLYEECSGRPGRRR